VPDGVAVGPHIQPGNFPSTLLLGNKHQKQRAASLFLALLFICGYIFSAVTKSMEVV
jgi:hypothetical protein